MGRWVYLETKIWFSNKPCIILCLATFLSYSLFASFSTTISWTYHHSVILLSIDTTHDIHWHTLKLELRYPLGPSPITRRHFTSMPAATDSLNGPSFPKRQKTHVSKPDKYFRHLSRTYLFGYHRTPLAFLPKLEVALVDVKVAPPCSCTRYLLWYVVMSEHWFVGPVITFTGGARSRAWRRRRPIPRLYEAPGTLL